MQERRKLPRWQVGWQLKIKLETQAAEVDCLVKDINFIGMQVALNLKLVVDSYIKFTLTLSDELSLDAEAWVAWHKRMDGRNFYGLYFSGLTEENKEKISKFVHHNIPENSLEGGERMDDRRIFQRFNVAFPAKLLDLNSGNEMPAQISDVSAKGLGLVLKQRVAANTPLEAWLHIPDEGEPLYARGISVWSKQDGEDQYRIGMDLEKADLMGLSRILRV